ncbi:MAG TPA: TIGR03617 family F420-dependent LLM class oxidoreductase [Bacillota bacterium]
MKIETALPVGEAHGDLDLDRVADDARFIEELGFDGLITTETKHDPFLPLALAAPVTKRLTLATAVAIAFPRSPMVVALAAWDLQRLSHGRFILGLGTQVKGHIERRYSAPWTAPGPRLREYVLALRAIWDSWQNGTPLRFEGEHYRFTLMTPEFNPGPIEHPHIPIEIAAVNAYNCRLAGEICDGIRTHPLASRKYLAEFVLPQVEAGARRAGRSLSDVQVSAATLIATGRNDRELGEAVEAVRRRIAFYASTRSYRTVLEIHGWQQTVATLHRLSVQGRWDEMPRQITDEMVETFAIVGTYDTIADRVRSRFEGIATRVRFGIPLREPGDAERLRSMLQRLRGETA